MKFNIEKEDFCIEENKKIKNINSYNSSYYYGEVDSNDIYNIIKAISEYNNLEDLHFLDIGSGCGKLTLYIYNKVNCYCTGVEIIKHRYLKSLKLLNDDIYNIEFLNDDFKNIYLGNFDIIFCCNIIFSKKDNDMLYFKLNKEFNGYALLFDYNNKISNNLLSIYNVNTSWDKNVKLYMFHF